MTKTCIVCSVEFDGRPNSVCCSKSCRGKIARSHQKSPGRTPDHGACVGGKVSALYRRWSGIKARCLNPNSRQYPDYGGRGISICSEWMRFAEFEKWANAHGFSAELEIDRIDNNKGYNPDNCRWTTQIVNANNRRNTVRLPSGLTVATASLALGITKSALRLRIKSGISASDAVSIPKVPNGISRKNFWKVHNKWTDTTEVKS